MTDGVSGADPEQLIAFATADQCKPVDSAESLRILHLTNRVSADCGAFAPSDTPGVTMAVDAVDHMEATDSFVLLVGQRLSGTGPAISQQKLDAWVQAHASGDTNETSAHGFPLGASDRYNDWVAQASRESRNARAVFAAASGGDPPHDTDLYEVSQAVALVQTPTVSEAITAYAELYDIDRVLLEGVVASELAFDHGNWDRHFDGLGKRGLVGPLRADGMPLGLLAVAAPLTAGVAFGARKATNGLGMASVHEETLHKAIRYQAEHDLPGALDASDYPQGSAYYRSTDAGSVRAAAIVIKMYEHGFDPVNGASTPEEFATIFGAYRTGVAGFGDKVGDNSGGFESLDHFRMGRARGAPPEFPAGGNAAMTLPVFALLDDLAAHDVQTSSSTSAEKTSASPTEKVSPDTPILSDERGGN